METTKKHNFGAGPCILPVSVMQQAANAVINWNDSGLSAARDSWCQWIRNSASDIELICYYGNTLRTQVKSS